MSVPKMRTASPNRVTIVTSASRISGDAGFGGGLVIGEAGSLRARRGMRVDAGKLGIGKASANQAAVRASPSASGTAAR